MNFLKIFLILSVTAFSQSNDVSRQEFIGRNILANPGFESGKQRWSVTGGTLSATTSGVGSGKGAVTWNSNSASQVFASTAVATSNALRLQNGVASCKIQSTGTATHLIQAYDASSAAVLASGTINSNQSAYVRTSVNFIFPAGLNVQLRIVSVASDEPEIYIDDCYLGNAEGFNIGEVSQATLVGTLKYAAASNCQWSGSSGSFANFSADTDCSTPTVTGSVTAPSTKIPAIVLNNLAPGKYLINFQGKVYSSAALGACSYRLSDGTNVSGNSASYLGSAGTAGPISALALSGVFDYSVAQSSVTIQAQQMLYSGGGSCNINNDVASSGDFEVQVFRFPSATEQAYRPETKNLLSTLKYAATTNCIWGSTSTSFANFSADTDCPTPTVTGLASAPGTKIPAIVVNNLPAGSYQVYIQGRTLADTAAEACAYRISDGTNASGTSVAFSNGGATGTGLGLSGVFTYTSPQSSVTFQVQASRFSGSGTCYVSIDNTAGGDYEIFVVPISPSIATPLLVGSVTSNSTGAERIERARVTSICTSNPCTISSQSGNWLTSIGWTTTGSYQLNIASGIFSATPSCSIVGAASGTAGVYTDDNFGTTSATTYQFRFGRTDTFAAINTSFNIICIGPR